MLIKKLNSGYHEVNKALYNILSEHNIICENNEMCLYEEVDWKNVEKEQFYPVVLQDIKKLGYDTSKMNKDNLKKLIAGIIDNIGDSYTIDTTKQYIEQYKQSMQQNNQNQTQPQQDNSQQNNGQTDNTQQNQEQPENQEEDPNVETISDNQSEEINKKGQDFINKNSRIYINQIRKYGMEQEVLDFINKSTQANYANLFKVPFDILVNTVSNYKPIREKILTDRFKASLNNYNISDSMKQDILKFYQDEEKNKQNWSVLFPKIMNKNENQSIFDFPIADYYIEKYNTVMADKIYSMLGKYIHDELNPKSTIKQIFGGKSNISGFCERIGILSSDSPEEISKKLKDTFGADIVKIINNYNNNALKNVSIFDDDINEKNAEEILKVIGNKEIIQQADIMEAIDYIKEAMRTAGLFPWIDYVIRPEKPNLNGTDETNENQEIAKVNLFTNYNVSAIINNLNKDNEFKEDWEVGYQSRTVNAIYDSVYYVPLKNKHSGLTGIVTFVSGFALLNIFKKNFRQGYQKGKNFKGFF